jgi:hypothetical protein
VQAMVSAHLGQVLSELKNMPLFKIYIKKGISIKDAFTDLMKLHTYIQTDGTVA